MSYKLSDEKDLTKSQIEYFFSPIATLYYLLYKKNPAQVLLHYRKI